jgi:hypothetical protein
MKALSQLEAMHSDVVIQFHRLYPWYIMWVIGPNPSFEVSVHHTFWSPLAIPFF